MQKIHELLNKIKGSISPNEHVATMNYSIWDLYSNENVMDVEFISMFYEMVELPTLVKN